MKNSCQERASRMRARQRWARLQSNHHLFFYKWVYCPPAGEGGWLPFSNRRRRGRLAAHPQPQLKCSKCFFSPQSEKHLNTGAKKMKNGEQSALFAERRFPTIERKSPLSPAAAPAHTWPASHSGFSAGAGMSHLRQLPWGLGWP